VLIIVLKLYNCQQSLFLLVTEFVRKNIGQYLEQCAAPMALGDANFGHSLVTQELLLDNRQQMERMNNGSGKGRNSVLHTLPSLQTHIESMQTVGDMRVGDLFPSSPSAAPSDAWGKRDSAPAVESDSIGLSPRPPPPSSLFKLAPLVEFPRCPKHL
jgi:hypothetical protein